VGRNLSSQQGLSTWKLWLMSCNRIRVCPNKLRTWNYIEHYFGTMSLMGYLLLTSLLMNAECRFVLRPVSLPFSTAGERFVKNMSISRNELITRLIYRFAENPVTSSSANPFVRPPMCRSREIHRINTVWGGKRHTMVMMFVGGVVLVLDRSHLLFLP
jgi:hypothetical protein